MARGLHVGKGGTRQMRLSASESAKSEKRYTIYKHWFLLVLIGGFILGKDTK